jgi:hypothetical protein
MLTIEDSTVEEHEGFLLLTGVEPIFRHAIRVRPGFAGKEMAGQGG